MKEKIKSYNSSAEKRSGIKLLVVEFIVLILIGLVLVFVLNYFNVVSLEKINSLFGALPSQEEEQVEEMTEEELLNVGIESPDSLPFAPCPLQSTELCIKGQIIDNGEDFYGVGYSEIPAGTEVLSVMKGKASVEEENGRNIITIDDGLGGQRTVINFIGEVTIPTGREDIEVGEPIGLIDVNGTSDDILIVSFQSAVNNEYIRPEIGDDGSYVHNRLL